MMMECGVGDDGCGVPYNGIKCTGYRDLCCVV